MMIVRVPASSANLGPGFDSLGMALRLFAEVGLSPGEIPAGARLADRHHPAMIAFRRGGGIGEIWTRANIPMGRGLGYSGAVRVGGLVAAHAQRAGVDPADLSAATPGLLSIAAELEGHADNVAASLYGGIVVAAAGRAIRIPVAVEPAVVVWVPSSTTSTDDSRTKLNATVTLDDAVFNVGRTALLVAALVTGETAALREAAQDRLHQNVRLGTARLSQQAMTAALDAGAWSTWLSGSGPTVAAFCDPQHADSVARSLPSDGRASVLRIAEGGAMVTTNPGQGR